ncbi:MAG: hypothetical protein QGH40_01475, partial [bacterium]|nr:hypothetical protein [bacterium]
MAKKSAAITQTKGKTRATIYVPVSLIERVKNAVYWTPGLTVAALAEGSLSRAVKSLENKRKSPFPQRKSELKVG